MAQYEVTTGSRRGVDETNKAAPRTSLAYGLGRILPVQVLLTFGIIVLATSASAQTAGPSDETRERIEAGLRSLDQEAGTSDCSRMPRDAAVALPPSIAEWATLRCGERDHSLGTNSEFVFAMPFIGFLHQLPELPCDNPQLLPHYITSVTQTSVDRQQVDEMIKTSPNSRWLATAQEVDGILTIARKNGCAERYLIAVQKNGTRLISYINEKGEVQPVRMAILRRAELLRKRP